MFKQGIKAEVLAIWGTATGVVASLMGHTDLSFGEWAASIALGFTVAMAAYLFFLKEKTEPESHL